jgi:hypothetical protein
MIAGEPLSLGDHPTYDDRTTCGGAPFGGRWSVVGGRPTGWVVGVLVCLPPVRGGLAGFPSRTPRHAGDRRLTTDDRPQDTPERNGDPWAFVGGRWSIAGPQEVQSESLHHRGVDRPLEEGAAIGRAGDRPGAAGGTRAAAADPRAGAPAMRSARRAASCAPHALSASFFATTNHRPPTMAFGSSVVGGRCVFHPFVTRTAVYGLPAVLWSD